MNKNYTQLFSLIKDSENVVVFTGAGVSTDSGIPDFRGPSGFWKTNQPIYFQDFIASEEARRLGWERKFKSERMIKKAKPNKGHKAIAIIINSKPNSHLITQNIDNLHQESGVPDEKITEIHGNSTYAKCLDCKERYELEPIRARFESNGTIPVCDLCGGFIKTATISFGQPMPEEEMKTSCQKSMASDLFISIGTSLQVYPAAGLPKLAKESGSKLVIINNEATDMDVIADLVINDAISQVFHNFSL